MEKIELNGPSMMSTHISWNISLAKSIFDLWAFFFISTEYGKSCISSYTRIVRTP